MTTPSGPFALEWKRLADPASPPNKAGGAKGSTGRGEGDTSPTGTGLGGRAGPLRSGNVTPLPQRPSFQHLPTHPTTVPATPPHPDSTPPHRPCHAVGGGSGGAGGALWAEGFEEPQLVGHLPPPDLTLLSPGDLGQGPTSPGLPQ